MVSGPKHYDNIMRAVIRAFNDKSWWTKCEEGFLDQFGNFLTREEAWVIALRNGQIKREVTVPGELYSENLY